MSLWCLKDCENKYECVMAGGVWIIYKSVRCWLECENYLLVCDARRDVRIIFECEMLYGVWELYKRVWQAE